MVYRALRWFLRRERREMARFRVVLNLEVLNFRPRRASSFLPMAASLFVFRFGVIRKVSRLLKKQLRNIQSS